MSLVFQRATARKFHMMRYKYNSRPAPYAPHHSPPILSRHHFLSPLPALHNISNSHSNNSLEGLPPWLDDPVIPCGWCSSLVC